MVHRRLQGEAYLVNTGIPIPVLLCKGLQGHEVSVNLFSRVDPWIICGCFAMLDAKGSTCIHEQLGRETGRIVPY